MTSRLFKTLGSFSEDCLHNALKHSPLSETTLRELNELATHLSKPIKEEKTMKTESRTEVFKRISEEIRKKVKEFNQLGKFYCVTA